MIVEAPVFLADAPDGDGVNGVPARPLRQSGIALNKPRPHSRSHT